MWQAFVNVLEYFQPREDEETVENVDETMENIVIPALEKAEETSIKKENEEPLDVEKDEASSHEKEKSSTTEKEEVLEMIPEESEKECQEQNKKAQIIEFSSAPEGMDISPRDIADFTFPEKTQESTSKKTQNEEQDEEINTKKFSDNPFDVRPVKLPIKISLTVAIDDEASVGSSSDSGSDLEVQDSKGMKRTIQELGTPRGDRKRLKVEA